MNNPLEPWSAFDRRICVSLVAAYALLMIPTLNWHCFISDEFHTIRTVKYEWADMVRERASNGHPPLFFSLIKIWMAVAPLSEYSLRALPCLTGCGTLLTTYVLVRQSAGRTAALVACAALTTSATQLFICQIGRSYSLAQLILAVQTLLLVAPARISSFRLASTAILTLAALSTHGSAIIAVAGQAIATLLLQPKRWPLVLSIATGAIAYALIAVLQLKGLDDVESRIHWVPEPTIKAWLTYPALLQLGRQLAFTHWAVKLFACFLVYTSVALTIRGSDSSAHVSFQWLFAWFASALAAGFGHGICHIERYFGMSVVCQAFILGIAVESSARWNIWLKWTFRLSVALLTLVSFLTYFTFPAMTPWREIAEHIQKHREDDDEVIVVADNEGLAAPFAYYYSDSEFEFSRGEELKQLNGKRGFWICFRDNIEYKRRDAITPAILKEYPHFEEIPFGYGYLVHGWKGDPSSEPPQVRK